MKENPILNLINYRNNIPTSKDPESERCLAIIRSIPVVDKQKLIRFSEDTQQIESLDNIFELAPLKAEFSAETLFSVISPDFNSFQNTEMYSIIFQYLSLGWYQTFTATQDPIQICNLLTIFSNIKYPEHENMNCQIFQLICTKYFQEVNRKYNDNVVKLIFNLIYLNKFPTPQYFPTMVLIFRMVSGSGNPPLITEMIDLIEHMTVKKFNILYGPDLSSLVIVLQQEIASMNLKAFSAVCRISNFSECKILNDSFVLLPSVFFAYTVTNTPQNAPYQIEKQNIEKIEYSDELKKSLFDELKQPPYDDLDYVVTICSQVYQKSIEISEALFHATPEMRDVFFQSMLNLLATVHQFEFLIELFNSFFVILKATATPAILTGVIPRVITSKIFNPEETIFSEIPVRKEILALRRLFFEDIRMISPELILTAFDSKYPILFAENLIRCQICGFLPSLFVEDALLMKINSVFVNLRGLSKNIESIRSQIAIFSFLLWPLYSEYTFIRCLELSSFNSAFSNNMYEVELTKYTVRALRDSLSQINTEINVSGVANSFSEACQMCSNDPNNERSSLLAYYITECLSQSIHEKIAMQFEPCLYSLFVYLSKSKNKSVLSNFLRFFSLIVRVNKKILENSEFIMKIISVVHGIDEDGCSNESFSILYSILTEGTCATNIFLIRVPQFLPYLVAAVGINSKKVAELFTKFSLISQDSEYNKSMLHEGGIDIICMLYINEVIDKSDRKVTITFGKINFILEIDAETWSEIAKPLMFSIFRSKSNNQIANLISLHISKGGCLSNDLLSELHLMRNQISKKFTIGLTPPPFEAKIPMSLLNDGFTLSFKIYIDPLTSNLSTEEVNLFNFSIPNSTFSFYLSQKTIYAMLHNENQAKVRVVLVNRSFYPGKWNTVQIGVNMKSKPIRFHPISNQEHLNESDFVGYSFIENPILAVCDGGSSYSCGYLSDIVLYQGYSDDLIQATRLNKIIDLNEVLKAKEIKVDDQIVNTKINYCQKVPYTLLESLARANNTATICKFFEYQDHSVDNTLTVIEVLSTIFKASSLSQRLFRSVPNILASLFKNTSLLTVELYKAMWNLFCTSLTDGSLRSEWLFSLILNTWLWNQSKSDNFIFILNHWIKIVIPFSTNEIKKKKNLFKTYMAQYKLFFCFDARGNHEHRLGQTIFDTFSKENLKTCQDLFVLLIKRLAYVNITKNDLNLLFYYISSSRDNKGTVLQLLKLVLDICPAIVKLPDYDASCLAYFLKSKDIDIVELAVLVIYNLSGDKLSQFLLSSALQIQIDTSELLNRLFNDLQKYENLYLLLIIFMLKGNVDMKPLAEILQNWINERKQIKTQKQWFIWILIAAIQKEDVIDVFSNFIAYVLSRSPSRNKELNDIVNFARFLGVLTPYSSQKFLESFFISLGYYKEYFDDTFTTYIADICFTSSIFHFTNFTHNFYLLQKFSESPFKDFNIYQSQDSPYQNELSNVTHLEHLMCYDISQMSINFFIDLKSDTGIWSQKLIAQISYDLYKNEKLKNYLLLFIDDSKLSQEPKIEFTHNSLEFFEKFHKEYENRFKSTFTEFSNEFRDILKKTKQLITDTQAFPSLADNVFGLIQHEMEKPQKMKSQNLEENERVRDKKTCMNYCAMKLKYPLMIKKKQPVAPETDLVYIQTCSLISKKNSREISLRIMRDCVYLVGSSFVKAFTIQMIRVLLTRKRSKSETAVEFYISDGRSYLIDLNPTDSSSFVKNFMKYMGSGQFVQSMPSAELFMSFPLTMDWSRGVLSNFEYLMKLNILSGRSFNDKNLYPVFPSVLNSLSNFSARDITKCTYNEPSLERVLRTQPKNPVSLEESVCKNGCIPPEFFYLQSVVCQSDNVNSFDFIYKHRKALESAKIRALIPKFIDNIWGVKGNSSFGHRQIFRKPHQPSQLLKVEKAKNISYNIKVEKDILYCATLKTKNPMHYSFMLFLEDGDIFVYSFGFQSEFHEKKSSKLMSLNKDLNCSYSHNNKGIARYSPENKKISIFKETNLEVEHNLFIDVSIIDYCDKSFIYTQDCCTVQYAADRTRKLQPITLYNSTQRIKLLKAHEHAKIFAVALDDGTVEVHSLVDGRFVGKSSLSCQPRHLIITNNSAFVICTGDSEILVLSIDGDEIKRAKIDTPLQSVFTFSDLVDTDYICAEDASGKLVFFEAMFPENMKTAIFSVKDLVFATYNQLKSAFVTVDAKGHLSITPAIL
ncbi:hypothetical protein TVAG_412990 [Trichomonas vaginalis G3]|uniref:BEACH domain-containing protein n=1 Tax=Trichomonas vaginalis (strain ATCC PRA-98 / G3) TaxID=412133 RepID=A2F6I4_TRIV3|nr:aggrephagy protein [Trichomonas vaginalis G3]EAX99482.1 hypothetical protein TVAG_412990 [Trichomonas vaginalis G3]KAI5538693.1 aggrephagy protein [Trichomonas vaginalis G3]|eukprot:XP_001312412.1 hypothetical protein [Trichomonas vaginalis G3]